MKRRKTPPSDATKLRRRAEARLRAAGAKATPRVEADALRLLHELEVHQVELQMQNEELRASRLEAEQAAKRYTELHDFAPVGYATVDRGGTILSVNFAGAGLLGRERSRLVGRRFRDFVSGPDQASFGDFLERALRRGGEGTENCEVTLEVRERLVRAHLAATALARTVPEALIAVQDVTERKRWEEELKETLRLLNASQQAAGVGTFAIDVKSGRWTTSGALDQILGIGPRFERTTAALLELVHPACRETIAEYLHSGARAGARLDLECRVVHPASGEVRWVWARGDVEYEGTDPVRVVGTIQDVTRQKLLQQERGELLRAAEVARAEAEAVNRSKDGFMAALSHELRNPLTPISNSLFILERSAPGSDQASRAVEVIARQVRHLTRLVDDLLDATRIARGKVQLRRERIDLNELVRTMVADLHLIFDGNGVRLDLTPAPTPVVVDGDWHRLAQVVGNLLQNAAKFCKRGGATTIGVSRDPREKHAVVRVADDGMGMAPDMLSRLFQPFSQADTTLGRGKGGLGLGMALARDFVELHGGRITARSAGLGKGAVFEVRLPLAEETAAGAATAPASGRASPRAPSTGRRVLVIEDNADAADSLRELLELRLHRVEVAHSGPEGLSMAHDFHPDVVLCDIGLPGMDGYEVARAMRADRALMGTCLIALSGYALPDDVRRAAESGFNGHIAKPPGIDDLDRVLAEVPPAAPSVDGSRPPP